MVLVACKYFELKIIFPSTEIRNRRMKASVLRLSQTFGKMGVSVVCEEGIDK